MLICWHPIANVRPAFDGLVIEIRNIIYSLESSNGAVELNCSSYVKAETEEIYLNPRSTRSTGSVTSAQESHLLLLAGFLDTAV